MLETFHISNAFTEAGGSYVETRVSLFSHIIIGGEGYLEIPSLH